MPGARIEHLGIRLTSQEKETLERAAACRHRTVSEFVRLAALSKAQGVLAVEHCKTRGQAGASSLPSSRGNTPGREITRRERG